MVSTELPHRNYIYRSSGAYVERQRLAVRAACRSGAAGRGLEYRDQEGRFTSDILTRSQPPPFLTCQLAGETCTGDNFAKYNVKEYYAEIFVPLLKDAAGCARSERERAASAGPTIPLHSIGTSTNAQFKVEYRPISDPGARDVRGGVPRPDNRGPVARTTQDAPTFNDPARASHGGAGRGQPEPGHSACAGVPRERRLPHSRRSRSRASSPATAT